jgi:hypothetical protein
MATSEYMRRTSFVGGDGKDGGFSGKQVTTLKQFEQRIIDGIRSSSPVGTQTGQILQWDGEKWVLAANGDLEEENILQWDSSTQLWTPQPNNAPFSTSSETRPALRFESSTDSANRAVQALWKGAFTLLFSPLRFNTLAWANGTNTQAIAWYFYQSPSGGLAPPFDLLGSI